MYAKSFDKQQLVIISQRIEKAQRIVLLSHQNADGDACGSLLGLVHQLDKAATHATAITPILPNGCPRNFRWMPASERILCGDTQLDQCQQAIADADLIICVDMNVGARIDFLQDYLFQASAFKILIDHHHGPDREHFDVVVSDPDISSTCELIVWLSQEMWGERYFDTQMATCLYTGLRTDTGGFAFSCDQPSCFDAASVLVSYDIQPAEIHNRIMNTFSFNRMQFYGYAISELLQIFPEQKVAIFAIPLSVQQRFGVSGEDMEGLVNYTLMMADIEVGALLREEATRSKASFRSKKDVDVNAIARQIGGGGHTKAAGTTLATAIGPALDVVKELLGVANIEPMKN